MSLFANSNYGRALALFTRDFLWGRHPPHNGDRHQGRAEQPPCRQRLGAAGDQALKAKRLDLDLSGSASGWGLGDSEMLLYARECTKVAVVTNLSEFEGIAEELVPR